MRPLSARFGQEVRLTQLKRNGRWAKPISADRMLPVSLDIISQIRRSAQDREFCPLCPPFLLMRIRRRVHFPLHQSKDCKELQTPNLGCCFGATCNASRVCCSYEKMTFAAHTAIYCTFSVRPCTESAVMSVSCTSGSPLDQPCSVVRGQADAELGETKASRSLMQSQTAT
jgi:hypothetical protein